MRSVISSRVAGLRTREAVEVCTRARRATSRRVTRGRNMVQIYRPAAAAALLLAGPTVHRLISGTCNRLHERSVDEWIERPQARVDRDGADGLPDGQAPPREGLRRRRPR